MRITYVGHATALIEVAGLRILTDPVLRGRVGHLRRQSPPPPAAVAADLDAVLISHLHGDHLDLPSLRLIPGRPALVGPKGAARLLRRPGSPAHELTPGERLRLSHAPDRGDADSAQAALITATPALHDGRRPPFGPRVEPLGYEIRAAGRRLYFAGDTDLFAGMDRLAGGPDDRLDVALLPIWGWGPNLGPGHMDPEAAARATALLRPRLVIPIHWGTLFPIGLGRWSASHLEQPPRRFAAQVAALAPETEVALLEPGDSIELANSA